MGIDTTIFGNFTCNLDELDEDFDIDVAWENFKKDNEDTDICWELIDGEIFEAIKDYITPPEFYVKGLIYICKNFLEPNGIYVFNDSVVYNCCECGTNCHGVISMINEHIKFLNVDEDSNITIKEYDYNGIEKLNFHDREIDMLKKRIEELETEIKYAPGGIGYQESKEHFSKLRYNP